MVTVAVALQAVCTFDPPSCDAGVCMVVVAICTSYVLPNARFVVDVTVAEVAVVSVTVCVEYAPLEPDSRYRMVKNWMGPQLLCTGVLTNVRVKARTPGVEVACGFPGGPSAARQLRFLERRGALARRQEQGEKESESERARE